MNYSVHSQTAAEAILLSLELIFWGSGRGTEHRVYIRIISLGKQKILATVISYITKQLGWWCRSLPRKFGKKAECSVAMSNPSSSSWPLRKHTPWEGVRTLEAKVMHKIVKHEVTRYMWWISIPRLSNRYSEGTDQMKDHEHLDLFPLMVERHL
jgi:hypothetical protein